MQLIPMLVLTMLPRMLNGEKNNRTMLKHTLFLININQQIIQLVQLHCSTDIISLISEVSDKVDPHQWETVDLENYRFSSNGQCKRTGEEMIEIGTYNALIGETMYYSSKALSFEDSHEAFRNTLGEGFAWEVLQVFSGPPHVTFTWRHFGKMTGELKCSGLAGVPYTVPPSNKLVEVFGMCKATVNDQLKIQDLQVFYDPSQLFTQMLESCPHAPFATYNKSSQ